MIKVIIDRDGVWAGTGKWDPDYYSIDGCSAVLGVDQDASDETYELLCDAIASLPQDGDMWRGPAIVVRPDGTYTAMLVD